MTKVKEIILSKGEVRKLNALRKSLGDEIANEAFAKWLEAKPEPEDKTDKNAELVANILYEYVEQGTLKIPKKGYHISRGRGRLIVTAVD
jgi:hypothetical protein